ncbi:hypothetical protein [Viridibacillus sp. FSL R5-0888]
MDKKRVYSYELKMMAIERRLAGVPKKQIQEELGIKNDTQIETFTVSF